MAFQLPSLRHTPPTLTQMDDDDDGNEEEQARFRAILFAQRIYKLCDMNESLSQWGSFIP